MPNLIKTKEGKISIPEPAEGPAHGPSGGETKPKKKTSWIWRTTIVIFAIALIISIGLLTKVVLAINSTNDASGKKVGFFEQIRHLVANPDKELRGEADDRINILLAGIGGAGHDGAYLADTIIFASIKPSTGEVAMMSIPRDLYVEIPEFGWRKINNALAFGMNSDYPGGGEALLAQVVNTVVDQPIHYYARIDFEGFRKAIDDLGGIKVNVDQSFTDYEYPDYNYGFQTISFDEGLNVMDGETALQFVRSRHGTNGEGSDFARSQRQQKVLLALKEKSLSLKTLLNPSSLIDALESLGEHNKTNLEVWEILRLANIIKDTTGDMLITEVLDTSEGGLLFSETTVDGAYILQPVAGDYSEIQYRAENIFNASYLMREGARIEIQNSTAQAGLASETAEQLLDLHYNVVKVGNANLEQEVTTTTIYDLSGGVKPYTVVSLKNYLQAPISPTLPAFMVNSDVSYETIASPINSANINATGEEIDILIILGTDFTADPQLSSKPAATS
ncbi:MAG: LCP family protein [Patescibacteria group bacterium]